MLLVALCGRATGDAPATPAQPEFVPTDDVFKAWETLTAFPVPSQFWRPSGGPPDVTIMIGKNAITASAPCFSYGSAFHAAGGKAVFDYQFSTSYSTSADCTPKRAAFDAFDDTLRGTAGFRRTQTGIVLVAADGRDIVALEPIDAQGFEFRELTVTSFRYAGQLRPVKPLGATPYLVFHSGQIDGTVGCGNSFTSGYHSLGRARYEFNLIWLYNLQCSNDKRADTQARRIGGAFDGIRDIEPRGDDFVLRDDAGRVQVILAPYPKGTTP